MGSAHLEASDLRRDIGHKSQPASAESAQNLPDSLKIQVFPVATQHASDPFPCLPSLGTKQQLKAKEKSSFVTFLLLLPWKDKMDLPVVDTGAEKCPRDWPRAFPWSPSSFRPSMPTLSALSCQKTGMNKLCSHPSEPSSQWKRTKSTNYDNLIPLLSVLRKPWCTRVLIFSWVIFPGCGWLKVRLTHPYSGEW